MIGIREHWEILDKSRDLILSSRQLLQQLNRRVHGTEPDAATLDSHPSLPSAIRLQRLEP